jgi:hypothetical protein
MNSKETLNKVMQLLGMHKQDEEVVVPEVQEEIKAEEAPVKLAEETLPLPTPEEEEKEEEKTEMAIEDVVAALEARIKSLEDKLAAAEVEVEMPEEEEEMAKKKKTMMSSEKKFTGAPVEKTTLKADPAFSMKVEGTMARVYQRLNN